MLVVLGHAPNAVAWFLPSRLMTSCAVLVGILALGLRQTSLTRQEYEPCGTHPEPSHAASLVQKLVRERVAVQTDEEAIHDGTVPVQLPATTIVRGSDSATPFVSAHVGAEIP